jgi:hypothetical protein
VVANRPRRTWTGLVVAAAVTVLLACHYDGSCSIMAAGYDQSCTVDSDCVSVTEVYGCGECACQTGTISKSALASYQSNAKGPLSQAAGPCNCPTEGAPQCCSGVCTMSVGQCSTPDGDAFEAGRD